MFKCFIRRILFSVQLLFGATKTNVALWTIKHNHLVLQNMLYQQTNCVAKNAYQWNNRWSKNSNQELIVAIETSNYGNQTFIVVIESPPLATKYLSWQYRVSPIATIIFSLAIECPPIATKYLSWQKRALSIATT